ncbi:MAG: hypothetical protein ACI9R3_000002 [Verrucomicrobiales bacterium]
MRFPLINCLCASLRSRRVTLPLLSLGTSCALIQGCADSESQTAATDQSPTDSGFPALSIQAGPAVAPTAAQSTPFGGKLAEEVARVDPAIDGWDSEALYETTQQQLSALAHSLEEILTGTESPTFNQSTTSFSSTFSAPSLAPETGSLKSVFEDAFVTIHSQPDNWIPTATQSDPQLALTNFFAPLSGSSAVQIKFKTFRVSLTSEGVSATTRVIVTSLGTRAANSQSTEQHAVWDLNWDTAGTAPQIQNIQPTSYRISKTKNGSARLFTDCTASAFKDCPSYATALLPGLDHWAARLHNQIGMESEGYQGMAMGDVNGDALDDLYLCQPGGLPNLLYIRNADGSLREAPEGHGTDWLERTRSALFVDIDNDRDQDLLVVCNTQVLLLENDGAGKFARRGMLQLPGSPFSCTAADYDSDGDLDVFVCDYGDLWGGFGDLNERFPIPYHDANNGGQNALFRNDGDWQFTNATTATGLGQNNHRWSLSSAWEDFDNDGDLDLYVANDFGRNNLYRNEAGTFTDIAATAGVEDISPGMSVTWGDVNRDGWMDLYVSNMFSGAGNRITFQDQFKPGTDTATKAHYQRFARGNALFLNRGDGTFLDSSEASGVSVGRWAWASRMADFNNDGLEDIVVANGFFTQEDSDDL